jgi:hypothetical protein
VATGAIVETIRADHNTRIGIHVSGPGNIVRNNQVFATGGTSVEVAVLRPLTAFGIMMAGAAPRVLNNDVTGLTGEGAGPAAGIFLVNVAGALVVNNRIASVDRGIEFASFAFSEGKYRDNLTTGVATPYLGGTDAGNNH